MESVIYKIERDLIETFAPRDNIYHNPNRKTNPDTSQRNAPVKIVHTMNGADTKTKLTNYQDFTTLVERGSVLFEKYRNEYGQYPY